MGMSYEEAIDYVQNFMLEPPLVFTDGIDRSHFSKDDIRCKTGLFWYAFEGKKFSPNSKDYPNCQGVVGWINPNPNAFEGNKVYIVLPNPVMLKYATKYYRTYVDDALDGWANTEKLLEYGREHGIEFSAAEYAYNYTKNGVKKGEAFLPAIEQLMRVCISTVEIRKALDKIGGIFREQLLSSSEYSSTSVYGINTRTVKTCVCSKLSYISVSCFLAY